MQSGYLNHLSAQAKLRDKEQIQKIKASLESETAFADFAVGMYNILGVHRKDAWLKNYQHFKQIASNPQNFEALPNGSPLYQIYTKIVHFNIVYNELVALQAYYDVLQELAEDTDAYTLTELEVFENKTKWVADEMADNYRGESTVRYLVSEIEQITEEAESDHTCALNQLAGDPCLASSYRKRYQDEDDEDDDEEASWYRFVYNNYDVSIPFGTKINP